MSEGDPLTTRLRAEGRHSNDVIDLWPRHAQHRSSVDDDARDDADGSSRARARRAVDVVRTLVGHRRRRGGGGEDAATRASRATGVLTDEELAAIETTYPEGITAVQVVEVFTSRGIKFSEASFRKYVQQGLLPRSRRVGRKGKHRGSLGVYPAKTIRRINAVKQLMNDGHTIEEIQADFLQYTDLVENLAESLAALFARMEGDLGGVDAAARKPLVADLADAKHGAGKLMRLLESLARRVAAPATDRIRRSGAAGSAEDLL